MMVYDFIKVAKENWNNRERWHWNTYFTHNDQSINQSINQSKF